MPETIGLDIGGTKVLGVLLDGDGQICRELRRASPHSGLDALVATGAAIVEELRTADQVVSELAWANDVMLERETYHSPMLLAHA